MNTFPFGAVQLMLRVGLGSVVGYAALLKFSIASAQASTGWPASAGTSPVLLHALMAMAAIWLIFGVRTRIVALLGLLFYAALWRLESQNGADGLLGYLVPLQVVVVLALPLILLGGGRFSLYRAGWRNLL